MLNANDSLLTSKTGRQAIKELALRCKIKEQTIIDSLERGNDKTYFLVAQQVVRIKRRGVLEPM